jgi:serpin B
VLTESLPAALKAAAADGGPLRAASRLWVAPAVAKKLQPDFVRQLAERYAATAQGLAFAHAEPARGQINAWVSAQTQGLIADLMPAGSVLPNTRLVLTQALHFRSPWAQPFDPAATAPQRFDVQPGVHKLVPTMHGEMKARAAEVGGFQVVELPFAQGGYVLQLVLPPAGQPLAQARAELDAADVAAWQAQLKPVRCQVELPRLALRSGSVSMKAALQRLGVSRLFTPQADFRPALGTAAAGLQVDEVIHAASFSLDESGGEAAAATGASVGFKSLDLTPQQACRFDRPFLFTLVHAPTQTPVLMGGVADPTQP